MAEQQEFADAPSAPVADSDIPQFSTAEYTHAPGTERCRICNNLIADNYFRVNNLMACAQCAADARNGQPRDSHVAFARGLAFGAAAAIAGMILYAAFTIITGWYIGYLALGVGYLVAKAIKKGANGLGGRRYQIAAVALTYAAISVAAVPIGLSYAIKHQKAVRQAQSSATPPATGQSTSPAPHSIPYGALAFRLLGVGLISPFLALQDPVHGAIGLFILFIGLRIAWQLTASAPLEVEGPYSHATMAP
jgi:hypothetical protein